MSKMWHQIFNSNLSIPPAQQRLAAVASAQTESNGFAIHFKSVSISEVDRNAQYQLRSCLYDAAYCTFFGKPWKSRSISVAQNRLDYNDTVFFHTTLKDTCIMLLVELVAKHHQSNSNTSEETLIGWSIVRFPQRLTDINNNRNSDTPTFSTNLYIGNPKMLCFLLEPVDQHAQLFRSGGTLELSIQTHRLLARAFDFMPENTFIGANEVIPGLEQPARGSPLFNPVPMAPNPAVLDQFVVQLGPHAEKIETELCELVNRERLFNDNRALTPKPEDEQMIILERRVRIGVHNGWTYLNEPFIFHLSTDTSSSSQSLRSKSLTKNSKKNDSTLVLRNRVELNDLNNDPGLAIVIVLDFIVGLQTHRPNPPSQSMVVCWGAWSPFAQKPPTAGDLVNVPLLGGPTSNPDDILCFKNFYRLISNKLQKQPTPSINVQFKFGLKSEMPDQLLMPEQCLVPKADDVSPESTAPSTPALVKDELLSTDQSTVREGPTSSKGVPAPPPRAGRKPLEPQLSKPPAELPSVAYRTDTTVTPHWAPYPEQMMAPYPMMPVHQFPIMTPLAQMIELPVDGETHAPIIALQQQALGIGAIPRATFALLSKSGFTDIKDRHGDPPDLIDPETSKQMVPKMDTELSDPLDSNEIILQFLALACPQTSPSSSGTLPARVFFTFQFYRFPQVNTERLLVVVNENEVPLIPRILKRLDSTGNIIPSDSGFIVKFTIDPQFLKPGEQRQFLQYLMIHSLHIDVWDADSLMLIGSCLLPLKQLCRCGKEAVQSYAQLPIVTTELRAETGNSQGTLTPLLKALLYLKVANVGYPHSRLNGYAGPAVMSRNRAVISQSLQRFGQTTATPQRVRARPLAMQNSNLIAQFSTSQKIQSTEEDEVLSEERMRKAERMKNIRHLERSYSTGLHRDKATKEKLNRELQTIKSLRDENKSQVLLTALFRSLTVVHSIFPSLGSVEFMEFLLQNPFSNAITVSLDISDPELKIITDSHEWQYFKRLNDLQTPFEPSMFLTSDNKKPNIRQQMKSEMDMRDVHLFLKPRESIYVPFKYQTFHSLKKPELVENEEDKVETDYKPLFLEAKTVKVVFKRHETNDIISIFLLQVEPQPHVVHQTFRFYHSENSFITKLIRITASIKGKGMRKVHCTDPTVLCELKSSTNGHSNQDLFLKIGCGTSPEVKSCYVMLYADPYMSYPVQTWHICAHALQRIDVSTVQGHANRFSMVLKAGHASQLIRVFSSSPGIRINPSEPFLLHPGSVTEIQAYFVPLFIGERALQINAVDVELHQLVKAWLICASVREPNITKAYQVTVPIGANKPLNKKVSFTNQYSVPRIYHIAINRDDLVSVRDSVLSLGPKETGTIALKFKPETRPQIVEVLVFINDENGNNEETYCMKTVYARG